MKSVEILTIGHSDRPLEATLAILADNLVTAVADVRSVPYSRHRPEYNREPFRQSLAKAAIRYAFFGAELGGRSTDASDYVGGRVQYNRLASSERFALGLERMLRGATLYRVAMLCTERDPMKCHRGLLIAPALENRGARVIHILDRGKLESQTACAQGLLRELGLSEAHLFLSQPELLAEAFTRRANRVAYRSAEVPNGPTIKE